jgi:serine/threonine protein kinase/Tfp pilus assembly protein PilF
MIERTLGHYRIVERLGAGGMGEVYRAHDTKLQRDIALKLLPASAVADLTARARLFEEARSASALNHPHICHVYEVDEADGVSYIAMELVQGRPLAAMIPIDGLPFESVVLYGGQIADALSHAHERGIIHRDLKSLNVVITPESRAKVLDFGLAKRLPDDAAAQVTSSRLAVADAGAIAGTVPYLAPEILRGAGADVRTDIWSLGVLLYEMTAGHVPFRGGTGFELTSAILHEPPAPLPESVAPGLRAVIQRCLAKEPGQRYRSASEVRAAIEAVGSSADIAVTVPRQKDARSLPLWAGITGAVVLAAALMYVAWVQRSPEKPASASPTASAPRLSTGGVASKIPEANEYYERSQLIAMARLDLPEMRKMLERALELDPHFAEARAEYGFTHALMFIAGQSNESTWLYKAEEEIRRALQDDSKNGRAHSALAAIYVVGGRKELAPAEVEKALQGNPNDLAAYGWLQSYHLLNGEYDRANDVARQALLINPNFFPLRMVRGETLQNMGALPAAIREMEKVAEQAPSNLVGVFYLARAYITAGEPLKARQLLERAEPGSRRNFLTRLTWALLLAAEGRRAEAMREMDEGLQKFASELSRVTLVAAEFFAILGEKDTALDWLARAVRNGDERADWFKRDPLLAGIRDQPRFTQILTSIDFRRQQRR